MFSSTGFSFGVGMGFTSEFGGLGSTMYKSEAAHEAAIANIKKQMATINSLLVVGTKYNGDSGGSLIGLIPEITARYDINHYMFVRTGFQCGQRLTGGQWDVTLTPNASIIGGANSTYEGVVEGVNRNLWNAGVDQIGSRGKTTYDYKFSSYEIPFVWGLNVPVADSKCSVYAAIGVKYAWYVTEKTVKFSSSAQNTNYVTGYMDDRIDENGLGYTTNAGVINDYDGYLAAVDRKNTKWKYTLHGLAITWLIGVDAKITDDFGLYLEHEFTTNTDSTKVKRSGSSTYKDAPAISSGTCRYYKVGAKYYLNI
jgi:hypothetical protein